MPALTELGKEKIKGIVVKKILDNIDAWQNWEEINTLKGDNCSTKDLGYLICKELTFRVLLESLQVRTRTSMANTANQALLLVYERYSSVTGTVNLAYLRGDEGNKQLEGNNIITIKNEGDILAKLNKMELSNADKKDKLLDFFKEGTNQKLKLEDVIFLIDNFVDYIHRTNFAQRTCYQLFSGKLPSLKNLEVIANLLSINIYDLRYFDYNKLGEIAKVRAEAKYRLTKIITNPNENIIIKQYLQISNYPRKSGSTGDYLDYLAKQEEINNNEKVILCYVAHLIRSDIIDENTRTSLEKWLERRGRIFSKQPETFNHEQFLTNFRTPNMNPNHSFWHDQPSIMVLLDSTNQVEYNFSSILFHKGKHCKPLHKSKQSIVNSSLLQKHIEEFIQVSIKQLPKYISDDNERGKFLKSLVLELFVDERTININYNGLKFDLGDEEQETIKILLRLEKRRQMKINLSKETDANKRARMSEKISAWQEKCEMIRQNSTEEYILNDINNITEPISTNLIGIKSYSPLSKDNINFIIKHGLIGAIWSRQLQNDTQQRIDELLTGDIRDLPRKYGTQPTHPNLLLLWDDANRLPDIPNSQNQPLSF